MKLTGEEKALLAGERGPGAQKAMEILVALGQIFGAEAMVPVASAQIAGVSYHNIGDAGLEFLKDWNHSGARASIPAFMNPAGIDRSLWKRMGISERFALKQNEIILQLSEMGVQDTLTCTPYHIGQVPVFGQHIAWSESSAVSYANAALGARTNREGGPSALAAAIVGSTPKFGFHLEQNRKATHQVIVRCRVESPSDFSLLGYWVGKSVGDGIPYFEGLELPEVPWRRTVCLKALGAAMAASGAVALYHVHGLTPEAQAMGSDLLVPNRQRIGIASLKPAREALKQEEKKLDLISLGCPHLSLEELREIASYLKGRRLAIPLWLTTSAIIRTEAEAEGIAGIIERTGALIIADTCMVVAPLKEMGIRNIAVDSAKAACYLPSHQNAITFWGSREQCLQAAIEGQWRA